MAEAKEKVYLHCKKCNRDLLDSQFYTYKDGSKTELCKKCLTMHIDPFDESTYVWLMEKMDVPYVPVEWAATRDKDYAKNPKTANGTAMFGKYLSKMRMNQYKKYGYAESEEACKVTKKMKQPLSPSEEDIDPEFEAEMKEKFEKGEISEAQYRTLTSTETQYEQEEELSSLWAETSPNPAESTFYDENQFMKEEDLPDPASGLTEEDKIYLAMKWGRLYKPNEWISLEQKYKEMTDSFDIQDSDTTGTLILICKTYLKMNQAVNQE